MADFPHLPLPQNVERRNYLGPKTPRKRPQRSQYNLDNRDLHVGDLNSRIANLETTWINEYHKLTDTSLQEYIDPKIIPIFLKVDVNSLNVDALRGFGIEIISQEAMVR